MQTWIAILIIFFGLHVAAADIPADRPIRDPAAIGTVNEPVNETVKGPVSGDVPPLPRMEGPDQQSSLEFRSFTPVTVMAYVSTLSLIVPLKAGASVAWNYDPRWTFEASAMSGSLNAGIFGFNIAKYNERSYQLTARYYGGQTSLHVILGLSQETGRFIIGNKYLNYATGAGNIDVAQLQAYAATVGIGQRWQWKNGLTVGVDYLTATVPFQVGNKTSDYFNSTASQSDKNQVSDTLNILARIPRAAFLTLSAGYSF